VIYSALNTPLLERADRWIVANPDGYLELAAPDITYFDPNHERRVDGLEALKALLGPIKGIQTTPSLTHAMK
jgi:hypothetical protein